MAGYNPNFTVQQIIDLPPSTTDFEKIMWLLVYIAVNGAGGGGGGLSALRSVSFIATANKHAYTAADVPNLATISSKVLQMVTDDDAVITTQATWDGTTFTINAGITVAGGEIIVILAQ